MKRRIEGIRIDKEGKLGKLAKRLYERVKETGEEIIKLNSLDAQGLRWSSIIRYYIGIDLDEPTLLACAFYQGVEDGKHVFGFIGEEFFNQTDLRDIWGRIEITLSSDVRREDTQSLHKKRYKDPAPQKNLNRYHPYVPRSYKNHNER